MVEEDKVIKSKIKQSGIFDFKELYRFCHDWLVDNGYNVIEKNYTEKVAGSSKEVEMKWEATKKISDYFKFVIGLSWRIVGLTDVEVEENGKKVKMNKGTPEITFSGSIMKDYENKWEDAPLVRFLRGVYDRYIIKSRIEHYEGKLFDEVDELVAQVKAFLAITGNR